MVLHYLMFLRRILRKEMVLFLLWNGHSIQIKLFFIDPICTLSIFGIHDYNYFYAVLDLSGVGV